MAKQISVTCDICGEPVGRMTKPVEKAFKDIYKRVFGKDLEDACASCQNPLTKLHDAYKALAAGGKREPKAKDKDKEKDKAPAGEPPGKDSEPKATAKPTGGTVVSAKQHPAEKGEKTPF